jgi:hypothetical protein
VLGFPGPSFTVSFEPKTNTNVSTHPEGSTLLKLAFAARSLIWNRRRLAARADTREVGAVVSAVCPLGGTAASPQAASRRGKPIAATSRDVGRRMRLSNGKRTLRTLSICAVVAPERPAPVRRARPTGVTRGIGGHSHLPGLEHTRWRLPSEHGAGLRERTDRHD